MNVVAFILLCVAVMVISIASSKPYGWVGLALSVLALLLGIGAISKL